MPIKANDVAKFLGQPNVIQPIASAALGTISHNIRARGAQNAATSQAGAPAFANPTTQAGDPPPLLGQGNFFGGGDAPETLQQHGLPLTTRQLRQLPQDQQRQARMQQGGPFPVESILQALIPMLGRG